MTAIPPSPSSSFERETSEQFWEAHYRQHAQVWSGVPNETLAAIARTLPPGRSLDLGCSNGGDATWLGLQGWTAIGVDVSQTAVDTASATAASAGGERSGDLRATRSGGEYAWRRVRSRFGQLFSDSDRVRPGRGTAPGSRPNSAWWPPPDHRSCFGRALVLESGSGSIPERAGDTRRSRARSRTLDSRHRRDARP